MNVKHAHPGLKDALALQNGNRKVRGRGPAQGPARHGPGGRGPRGRPIALVGRKQEIRRTLGNRQRATASRLRGLGARIQYSYTDVFNGFRVTVKAKQVSKIARLPNVRAVLTVPTHTIDNTNTVSYLGADKAWGQTGRTGKGVTIAIIDSGINYYHLDFGGAGNAAWRADDPTRREPGTFPTAKVVGGYDFAGDDYDADTQPVPHPDPDPLDCKAKDSEIVQHGTHVAGTAAGTGVTVAGRTYTGPYDTNTLSRTDFRIGPGVAPQARLLAYRVFGCAGSTTLLVDAIERAVQDGADVINMSIGAPFGDAGSLDAVASDNASLAGVVVVAAAGNEGASAYMTGSPGVAQRSIAVAALDAERSFPAATVDMATGADVDAINANDSALPVSGRITVFRDDPSTSVDPDTGKGNESLGCFPEDYTYNGFTDGRIAVVYRGICPRTDRAVQGQQQHAAAVIMINTADWLPPFENIIGGVTIPFIGVSGADEAPVHDRRRQDRHHQGRGHHRQPDVPRERGLHLGRSPPRGQRHQAGHHGPWRLGLLG